jgi:predicted Fe-Mo cluster-binding NifX family protein
MAIEMTCWKWFNNVLNEAGIEITAKNEKRVDEAIHKYIGEQSSYGRCSADWRKAKKEIEADPKMKKELIAKLQTLV